MSNISELPIDSIEIDSFKIRIPISNIKIVDESLRGKWVLVNEVSGDIDNKVFKENSLSKNENGIKIKYGIERQNLTGISSIASEEFLIILINSKLLKGRYFEGITKDNIDIVYRELINHKVVSFAFDDLLNSEITDVDFKRDVIIKSFDNVVKTLFSIAKASKKKDEGAKIYVQKSNMGIEFSDRATQSYLSNPFLKVYHKGIHCKKSDDKDMREFYTTYLFDSVEDSEIDNRVRTEYTVKNKKHFRQYNILSTTLSNILNLTQEKKLNILRNIAGKHLLKKQVRVRMIKEDLTPSDKIILGLLDMLLQNGIAFSRALESCIFSESDRVKRSRLKSKLTNLYSKYLENNDDDIKAKNTDFFVNWLLG